MTESFPLRPSALEFTVILPPCICKSSLLVIPLLYFPSTVNDPLPIKVRSDLLNIAALGSSVDSSANT